MLANLRHLTKRSLHTIKPSQQKLADSKDSLCQNKQFHKVVMTRHGESEWNQINLFSGWVNAKLSERGIRQASRAGQLLKKKGFTFDLAFTSVLNRASQTLNGILKEMGLESIEIRMDWRLNERHYGALTGLDKSKTVEKYGRNQVLTWRSGLNATPPPMEIFHPRYKEIVDNPIFMNIPKKDFPMLETLKETYYRTTCYWSKEIIPEIKKGRNVLIVGHNHSLRGLVQFLDQMSDEDFSNLHLPNCIPFLYQLDSKGRPTSRGGIQFLADSKIVKMAVKEEQDKMNK